MYPTQQAKVPAKKIQIFILQQFEIVPAKKVEMLPVNQVFLFQQKAPA